MNEILKFPQSSMVMESVIELMQSQPAKDRFDYKEIALEAILSPAGKSKMIQKLYTDIISKSDIDFGKIPESKGNLTKYVYYESLYQSIEALNKLFEGSKTVEELELTNSLHNMIISCVSDFEFGYKFDIDIIKLTYNLLVMALHEMVCVCISLYTDYLKDVKNVSFKFVPAKKKNLLIIKYVKDMLKSYDNGEWTKLMLQFKKNSSNLLGSLGALSAIQGTTGVISLGIAPMIIISFLVLLFSIRGLIYIYYHAAFKLNNFITINADFLRWNVEMDRNNTDSSLEKQKKMLNALDSVQNFIETKILKTESDAKKELEKSNKENFSKEELQSSPSGIELI